MNVEKLIDAIGSIDDDYIEDTVLSCKKVNANRYGWIAAAIIFVFAVVFFQTPPGVAAFTSIKENVIELVEQLFPPKDVIVNIEGESEIVQHTPVVQNPVTQENNTVTTPGFVIYYDPDIYTMIKEDDATYIRYVTDDKLPVREMEIKFIPDADADAYVKTVRTEKCSEWAYVSEIYDLYGTDAVCFDFSAGDSWDSECGKISIFSVENKGIFQITARYFGEAQEGHGVRFSQMLQTFEVIE